MCCACHVYVCVWLMTAVISNVPDMIHSNNNTLGSVARLTDRLSGQNGNLLIHQFKLCKQKTTQNEENVLGQTQTH